MARIVEESCARQEAKRSQKIKDLETSILVTDQQSAQRLRRLRKAKDVNQLFSKLRSIHNPGVRAGVTRIEVPVDPNADPKACIQWRQIEVPTEVLMHLQERNRKHLGHGKGSPFMVPPLSEDLGFCNDGPASIPMLNGSYDVSKLDTNAALLEQHLKQTSEMAALETHPTISVEEYVGKLKILAESTSTSQSGLHLGHCKEALMTRQQYSDIDTDDALLLAERDEWNRMQE